MSPKALLICFLLGLGATSCLEEDSGLSAMLGADAPDFQRPVSAAVANGTDLPTAAIVERVTLLDAKGQPVQARQMHIGMEFRDCTAGWCKALVDDCGIGSNIEYNYVRNGASRSVSFANFSASPAVRGWALEGMPFTFVRTGAEMNLSCADCPGTTQDGVDFTARRIDFRVVVD